MFDGTDPTNFPAQKGGWNCRHQLYPVPDYMVPEDVRKKLEEKTNFAGEKSKSAMAKEKYLKEMEPLLEKRVCKDTDKGNIAIGFTRKGNKHLYSDTLGRVKDFPKEDLKNLHTHLQKSIFVKSVQLTVKRKDDITKFYYFKDKGNDLYYNVAEVVNKGKVHRYMYSITSELTHLSRKQTP